MERHGANDSARPGLGRREFLASCVIASVAALVVPSAVEAATEATAADWRSVLEAMFPHARVDRSLYAVPAGALMDAAAKDPATRALLAAGWRELSAGAGGEWRSAAPEARTRALAAIAGTPLFAVLRQTTVFTFYANPKVWDALGYEGDAWRFGGWLGPKLVTVDWLPDPPAAGGA